MARMPNYRITRFLSGSPLRCPAWRWVRACELDALGQNCSPRECRSIRLALKFLRWLDHPDGQPVGKRLAAVHAAYTLNQSTTVLRDEVEARLLADQGDDEISAATGMPSEAVGLYERLFFAVRDAMDAMDWVLLRAVRVQDFPMTPTEGQCWRWLAVAAGPVVLNLVIADFHGRTAPHVPERTALAQEARYFVAEYAARACTGPATARLVEEGCQRFARLLRGSDTETQAALLRNQVGTIRLAAGLPPLAKPTEGPGDQEPRSTRTHARKERNADAEEAQAV